MIPEIDVPKSGQPWKALCRPVIALAKAVNGLRKLRFEPGPDWKFTWDDGGAVITTSTQAAGGQLWYLIAVDGQPMYVQLTSGTPQDTLPDGAALADSS